MPVSSVRGRAAQAALVAVLLALALTTVVTAAAFATAPRTLWTVAASCGHPECTGTGEPSIPRGVAADPQTGNVYVADQGNQRVDEYTAWGQFLRSWGWNVVASGPDDTGSGEFEICNVAVNPADVCQAGGEGAGTGEFNTLQGVAVDSHGDVYVADKGNHRVQKFDSEGHFILMFGGQVNRTAVSEARTGEENVCPAPGHPSDTCQAGVTGTSEGEFSEKWPTSSYIAVGPGDTVYVGDDERVQEFNKDGSFLKSVALPSPGETVQSLAVDGSGDIYVAYVEKPEVAKANVRKLGPSGEALCEDVVAEPKALATDPAGNLYVYEGYTSVNNSNELHIRKFNPTCTEVTGGGFPIGFNREFNVGLGSGAVESSGIAANVVTQAGGVGVYVTNVRNYNSFVRAFFPAPDRWPPPVVAPSIDSQYAVSVSTDSARLGTEINPHFWRDTRYFVQYGTGRCSEGGCGQEAGAPGVSLTSEQAGEDVSGGVLLSGLSPGTTYHYRFVASSSGGGPVTGQGGTAGSEGTEGTFTTYAPAPLRTDCANQQSRTGVAAVLPDCRAYEMVSPIDKNGGDITLGIFGNIDKTPLGQSLSAADGERVSFSTLTAFGNTQAAPLIDQFLSVREADGWSTRSISTPRANPGYYTAGVPGQYQAFNDDLCTAWFLQDSSVALVANPPQGEPNLYRRDLCGSVGYELLTSVAPEGFDPEKEAPESHYYPDFQGASADGSHSVFRADSNLTSNACVGVSTTYGSGTGFQLYETSPSGSLRLVSVLPNGEPNCSDSSVGTFDGFEIGFSQASVYHAVSPDGETVFWSSFIGGTQNERPLYVRVHATQRQSRIEGGRCTESARACTFVLSEGSITQYWSADREGKRALYTVGKQLSVFDVAQDSSAVIAEGVVGVAGASEDISRIYFASTNVLSGTQQNDRGAVAQAGQPNVYLYETGGEGGSGRFVYIATIAEADLSGMSAFATRPLVRSGRLTPDGSSFAFISQASLTGYDNTELSAGKPASEVYRYEAAPNGVGSLHCVSCAPNGARPSADGKSSQYRNASTVFAAWLPGWPDQLHPSRLLSVDGSRLFFDSFEPLVGRDTNGREDVYEWERASGAQACTEAGAEAYVPDAGGCLSLISSGASSQDSEVIDASETGGDVFFTTSASLLPQDPGLIDIYDARVNGGFPLVSSPASCEGEACQAAPTPPFETTPSSLLFTGEGNIQPPAGKPEPKKRTLTRAQKLARALQACRKQHKSARRKNCEKQARKGYKSRKAASLRRHATSVGSKR